VSRVGKNPISIPAGVQIKVENDFVCVTGPKGELCKKINPNIKLEINDDELVVSRPNDSKVYKSLHGLYRSLLNNMVEGVSKSFEKRLEIVGVGYRAELSHNRLNLQLGYSHPIVFVPPEGIDLTVENPTNISIRGIDKELVGMIAAKIRSFRPPEPYKGKGIKYVDEHVRRKAGKTAT
jgi:large subunit ribosomal protein L6